MYIEIIQYILYILWEFCTFEVGTVKQLVSFVIDWWFSSMFFLFTDKTREPPFDWRCWRCLPVSSAPTPCCIGLVLQHYCTVLLWCLFPLHLLCFYVIFRPHRMHSIDAACCYACYVVVCVCVCLKHWWALQKRLNRSRCYLACGLGWAQGTMY